MKISDIILNQGIERRFRGPRKPRLKQVGLHNRMKNLLDNDLSEAKNTHLDHAEELIFMYGQDGLNRVVSTYSKLLSTLDGDGGGDAITTKWDGAPAIFAGVDPEDGEFFVGTKGVFAKSPKLNKKPADIEKNHADVTKNGEEISKKGLRDKLYASLEHLKNLGISDVVQGDLLFTRDDLKEVKIEGKKYIAFKPNTITYVVPVDSDIAREMLSSELGVVFHTNYTGDTLSDMSARFGYDASNLNKSSKVWYTDARIKDVSGQVNLSKSEISAIKTGINELSSLSIPSPELFNKINDTIGGIDIVAALKAHANTPIRSGNALEQDADKFVVDFINKLKDKFDTDISKLKTGPEGKAGLAKLDKKKQVVEFIEENAIHIANMYRAYLKTEAVKMMFQRKMRDIKAIDSFIAQPDGSFKVTDPEGFVIVDHVGRAMKIVDRLEFSAANFAK